MRSRNHSFNARATPPKDTSLPKRWVSADWRATKNNSPLSTFCAIGRSACFFLVHSCSPRTLRVAQEEPSSGGGNNRGLTKNQAPTETAWSQLRVQTGRYTRG